MTRDETASHGTPDRQELGIQQVEHENLLRRAAVTRIGRSRYAMIDGKRHRVHPTGNDQEPWTTNSRNARWP